MIRIKGRLLLIAMILPCVLLLWGGSAAAQRAVGACCLPNETCDITTAAACNQKGGTFLGLDTSCDDCPPECDDGDPCTEDSWDGFKCIYTPLDCSDGDPCTTDVCVGGECAYIGIICSDGDPCTTDSCVGGDCVYTPLDCDDDDPCTIDSCFLGQCRHSQIICSDGNPCTTDACVGGDCVYTPLNCDDEDPCTTDVCVSGECAYIGIICDDGNSCTTDSCVGGDCTYVPLNCDDDDPCTTDTCSGGDCIHVGLDCDDDDPTTVDACVDGRCRHTPIEEPASQPEAAVSPVVWYLDEGPWGEDEIKLHAALCAGAARAGAEFRALMYEEGQIDEIEKLLLRLSDPKKPDLILCSRKTIDEIDAAVTRGILFFDVDALGKHDDSSDAVGIVGFGGPRADWTAPANGSDTPFVGLQSLADGLWDLSMLPDPLTTLQEFVAAREEAGRTGGPIDAEAVVIEELVFPGIRCCLVAGILSARGDLNASELFEACCAGEGLDPGSASVRLVVPTSETATPEGNHATGDMASSGWLLRWLMRGDGADPEPDETWQRIKSGIVAQADDELLVETFQRWLAINGHTDAASRIAEQIPFPEDSAGYEARYGWFRESMKQHDPTDVPWWLPWLAEANADSVDASRTLDPPLLLILSDIKPESGELMIDLVVAQ